MPHKPYPEYKDSGVEWLDKIPEDWKMIRLKFLKSGPLVYGLNESAELDDPKFPRFIRITDVNDDGTLRAETFKSIPPKIAEPYLLKEGDILFARSGATVGKAFMYKTEWGKACFAGYLIRLRADLKKVTPNYLDFYTQSETYNQEVQANTIKATIQNVNAEKYSDFLVALPSLTEQKIITSYLYHETARIDSLIDKKQKMIELLQEKRQAVISQAVTKGLDPNVKMKDSGIEWIGKIPEQWNVLPLKRLVSTPITDGPHETPEILDVGIPFVSAEAIKDDRIDFSKIRGFISAGDHKTFSKKYKPKFGDIYMVKSGATTGNMAMAETLDEFNIWSPLAAIRISEKMARAKFVFHAMKSKEFQTSVQLAWSYGTQQNIGMSVIENLIIPVPSLEEQGIIVKLLDLEIGKITHLISKIQTSIGQLQEFRQALISAAVTGKIDLRKEVA